MAFGGTAELVDARVRHRPGPDRDFTTCEGQLVAPECVQRAGQMPGGALAPHGSAVGVELLGELEADRELPDQWEREEDLCEHAADQDAQGIVCAAVVVLMVQDRLELGPT